MYAGTNARMRAMNACMTGGGDGLELLTTSLITDYLYISYYLFILSRTVNHLSINQIGNKRMIVRSSSGTTCMSSNTVENIIHYIV